MKKLLVIVCILGCTYSMVSGVSASLDLQGSENYYTENDTITAGMYPLQYVNSISTFVDDNTAISNITYSMGVDNMEQIISIGESQYVTRNSTDITWVFPNSLVLKKNEYHLVQIRTDLYSPQYVPMSLFRTMNQTQFSTEGYQKTSFGISFENITYAYQNKNCDSVELGMHANENNDLNATLLLDTLATDAPGTFYNNNSHSFAFVFDKSRIALNRTYNFSIVIHVVPNGTSPVTYKPYIGVTLFNYTSRSGTQGVSTSMPVDMLPPHLTYATASQNASLTWNYYLEYGRGARLSETRKKVSSTENSTIGSQIGIFRPSSGNWYFDYNLDGMVNNSFRYGSSTDQIIQGDWDGNGKEGIAIFRPLTGYWYFDNNLDGVVDKNFRFGGSADTIIAGNWTGASTGIAIFRTTTGYWYFDDNLDGVVDKSFRFGGSTDQIIKGDWQGSGREGIAIFRPSTGYWYFDYNLDGIVDKSFRYGGNTDRIIGGKWQGLQEGVAIFRSSTGYWYFDYDLDGIVDKSFRFGGSSDQIIAGDWQGTGTDGIAIFRPSTGYWYFDYNLDGIVDKSFRYGGSTDKIIVGKWV